MWKIIRAQRNLKIQIKTHLFIIHYASVKGRQTKLRMILYSDNGKTKIEASLRNKELWISFNKINPPWQIDNISYWSSPSCRQQLDEQARYAKMERRRQEKLASGGSLGRSFSRSYGTGLEKGDKDKRRASLRVRLNIVLKLMKLLRFYIYLVTVQELN